MSIRTVEANVEIDVVRLDSDIIEEHLRSSTAVLQDILTADKFEHGNIGYRCAQCGKLYKTASSLNMHIHLKHPADEVEVECTRCRKKYPSRLSLHKHERYMHLYNHRCKACYKTFPTVTLLAKHESCCVKKETPCDVCGKVFDSSLALRNHNKYMHPGNSNSSCEVCRRSFKSVRSLSNHMAAVHPTKATRCQWCNRSFNSARALEYHTLYKHKTDGVRCAFCAKIMKSNNGLYRHLLKIHLPSSNYWCEICKINFCGSKNIVQHVMDVHTDNNGSKNIYIEPTFVLSNGINLILLIDDI